MRDNKDSINVHLRKLIAVYEAGSQSEASRKYGWSPSTISGGLETLERALGYRLRKSDGLNVSGTSLAARCQPLLAALDQELEKRPNIIRVGITHYVASNFLTTVLSERVNVSIHLHQADANSLLGQLASGKLDMVVGPKPVDRRGQFHFVPAGNILYKIVANHSINSNYVETMSGEDVWRYLFGSCRWAVNGVGTTTRDRISGVMHALSIQESCWLRNLVVESSDERVLLEAVSRSRDTVAILPWGPELGREIGKRSSHPAKIFSLPDSPPWPHVTVGVTISAPPENGLLNQANEIQGRLGEALN